MSIRRFFCCLFALFFLAVPPLAPVWAAERIVRLTVPGCDS
ncbi:MAG TPA: hypothetical protein PK425_06230 [Syntrophales bacterium]|nr:hypothetical protein [Syntrophales bacterium]HPX56122.1 hypothetical protein [Syntrophales bacterium]HQA83256.1 hypothetical protein [Syntrophales bacterium]